MTTARAIWNGLIEDENFCKAFPEGPKRERMRAFVEGIPEKVSGLAPYGVTLRTLAMTSYALTLLAIETGFIGAFPGVESLEKARRTLVAIQTDVDFKPLPDSRFPRALRDLKGRAKEEFATGKLTIGRLLEISCYSVLVA
ncbi:MAG: hypothetical protein RLZZ324_276 [Candidatus Parcubacteria bacterium]|jgi:hypothetical protein